MRPFKISIHNRKGVGIEFDFEEGHLLVRLLNAMAATLNDPNLPDDVLDRIINDMVWGGVIDDIHTVMSVEQMDETADLLDRLVTAGEDLLGDGGELDESDEETGGGGV